jgi:hypothetical protein
MKRKLWRIAKLLAVVTAAWMGFGCATMKPCDPKPQWISQPQIEGYYVGVGSADTGSEAEDRAVAEARARADLASRISATIRSELEIATSESTAEGASQEVSEQVTQSVEANLQDIETVDSYYCPREGSWIYVRLHRARWAEIQEERRKELNARLEELVEPVIEGGDEDFLLELETLLQARALVYGSTLGPSAKGKLAGQEGNLSDILGTFINRVLSSLTLNVEREKVSVSIGEEAELSGRIESSLFERIGNVEIVVLMKEGARLTTTQSDEQGFFSLKIPQGFTEAGEKHMVLRPAFQEYEGEGLLPKEALPAKEVVFSVQRVPVGLLVESSGDVQGMDLVDRVQSLFSERQLPFELVEYRPGGDSSQLLIRFTVDIEDFPKMDANAPDMARARAVVSFQRASNTLYSYESHWLKDGGLDPRQAHRRVTDKLFGELAQNEEMFSQLKNAVVNR